MPHHIDCACVIHGDLYPWIYVERLYNMLTRNMQRSVRLHVFTEPERPVPPPMIRHDLYTWPGVGGRKKGWWYKLQMFDPRHQLGTLLYFDLDVVIIRDITWITELDVTYFWALRDFKYLWKPKWQGVNTTVMWWNTPDFYDVWQDFSRRDIGSISRQWRGDQDYITDIIPAQRRRFIDPNTMSSWRWQIKDGGMDPNNRIYRRPDAGSIVPPDTHVMVFHGEPKPHAVQDPIIKSAWR
jgi:hypothetical protein